MADISRFTSDDRDYDFEFNSRSYYLDNKLVGYVIEYLPFWSLLMFEYVDEVVVRGFLSFLFYNGPYFYFGGYNSMSDTQICDEILVRANNRESCVTVITRKFETLVATFYSITMVIFAYCLLKRICCCCSSTRK